VPMVFSVYVHVLDVMVSLTAATLPTNSTAVSLLSTSQQQANDGGRQ